MLANILTTLIGFYLAYLSIFGLVATGGARWREATAGAAIIVLARLARRSDVSGWQSTTNAIAGGLLLLTAALNWVVPIGALALFWINLWIGLIVACLALWAALYHPERRLSAAGLMPKLSTGSPGKEQIGRAAE